MKKLISVVIPVYQSAEYLRQLHGELKEILGELSNEYDHEIIFVDDCSLDNSFSILKEIAALDISSRVLKLRDNYGQHAAVAAGLEKTSGDFVIVMDADLQDSPQEIPRFLEIASQGNEIVVSIRTETKGTLVRRFGSFVVRKLIPVYRNLPNGLYYGSYALLSRTVVDTYLCQPDRFQFFLKVLDRLPYSRGFLKYRQSYPEQTSSSYSIPKLLHLFARICPQQSLDQWRRTCLCLAALCTILTVVFALNMVSIGKFDDLIGYSSLLLSIAFLTSFTLWSYLSKVKLNAPIIDQVLIQEEINISNRVESLINV